MITVTVYYYLLRGILSQKGKDWYLATSDGSHKVLEAAVNHFGFKEGDHLVGILPQGDLKAPFAALEGLVRKIEDTALTGVVGSKAPEEIKDKKETGAKVPEIEKSEKTPVKTKSRPTLKKEDKDSSAVTNNQDPTT